MFGVARSRPMAPLWPAARVTQTSTLMGCWPQARAARQARSMPLPDAPFDFHAHAELPAPTLPLTEAAQVLARLGIDGQLYPLGSQQDQNFLVTGPVPAVLKLANPAFPERDTIAQDLAAALVATTFPDLRIAQVLRRGDAPIRAVVPTSYGDLVARVLEFLPGGTYVGQPWLSPAVAARMGRIAGQVSLALADFDHPGAERRLQWDLRSAADVIALIAPAISDDAERRAVEVATAEAWAAVAAVATTLPVQAGHFDLTDDNLVRGEDGLPDGIIDFGDVSHSWRVAELAITLSGLLHHTGPLVETVTAAIRAFHAVRPLASSEVDALWPLVVLRGAVLVASGRQQATLDADNAYAVDALDREWQIFAAATSVPLPVMTGVIRAALGIAAKPLAASGARFLPEVPELLDLGVMADATNDGAWLTGGLADRLAADRPLAAAPWGIPRLSETTTLRGEAPATVPTSVTLWSTRRRTIFAPWGGEATVEDGRVVLRGAELEVVLHGAHPAQQRSAERATGGGDGWRCAPGAAASAPEDAPLRDGDLAAGGAPEPWSSWSPSVVNRRRGELASGEGSAHPIDAGGALADFTGRIDIQVRRRGLDVPLRVPADLAPGWLALTADPSALLGLRPSPAVGTGQESSNQTAVDPLLSEREAHVADVQEHYYAAPPQLERGWRAQLVDTGARAYLDMVNNVTSVGHAHPRITAAVTRQLSRLNTNSRFHYAALPRFASALAATLPEPLDQVFLVNSGSEATDLAIRLAMAATGRRDIVALAEAYHGWTYASDAVSTSVADNPNALSTRPDWVHTVEAPNAYRGRWRDAESANYGPEAATRIAALSAAGHAPAGFIAESISGNAGGILLPDGYLAEVYAAVRAAGGLAIADEVQVGYGRLGDWFWGFQQQGVLPDIVAVAKSMGNGHPLGAVITTGEIARAYRNGGYFFSSTGGSPVSATVGLTVLEIIAEEDLQANAVRVGARLKHGLEGLMDRHSCVGTVHGHGLYLGLELVADRQARTPDAALTRDLCERLRQLGVIMQPTGDHGNVLKIKPPLVVSAEEVDFFVAMVDRALAELR